MNIPSQTELQTDSQKVFKVDDKALVIMSTIMDSNEHIRSLARAEQTRRQTEAIHDFNKASGRLAWVMIGAALIQIFVAIFKK